MTQTVKCLPAVRETQVRSLVWEDPLEKEMATQSSILAWKIPCTEELGEPQFMELKKLDTTERLNSNNEEYNPINNLSGSYETVQKR